MNAQAAVVTTLLANKLSTVSIIIMKFTRLFVYNRICCRGFLRSGMATPNPAELFDIQGK